MLDIWKGIINKHCWELKNTIEYLIKRLIRIGKKEPKNRGEGYKHSPKTIIESLA